MDRFCIDEMQQMQRLLQEKYRDKWEPICPAVGQNKLLWMVGEIGEVIDILKKNDPQNLLQASAVRSHLVEEMADVLMYFNDVMLCFGITEDELKTAYYQKFKKNMQRW